MPTHFDVICAFAEKISQRHPTEEIGLVLKLLREARLFEIESAEPRGPISDEEARLMGEDFHLPFDTIAVEDAKSCVLITDSQPGQSGLDRERMVIVGADRADRAMVYGAVIKSAQAVKDDRFRLEIFPASVFACVRLDGTWHDVHTVYTMPPEALDGVKLDINTHFSSALREILLTNVPSNFILESSPLKTADQGKRIPRSHERSTYTLLKPGEIRRRMHLPEPTGDGSTRAPHERRAHFRTLRDERYTRNPDGTPRRLWIPATWVGPTESVVGQRRYRVILD